MYPPLFKQLDYTPVLVISVCIRQPCDQILTNFLGDFQSISPIFLRNSAPFSQISAHHNYKYYK
jgi:hypothetical protein